MTKGAAAGSKLYYAVNKSTGTCDFEELCDQIADRSTASRGDVQVVVDGLLYILKQRLPERGDRPAGRSRPLPSRDRQQGHQAGVRLQRLPYQTSPDRLPSERDAKERHRPRQVREDRARRTRPGRRRQRIPRRNLTQGSPR